MIRIIELELVKVGWVRGYQNLLVLQLHFYQEMIKIESSVYF